MNLTVYLAGQIHDEWRETLKKLAKDRGYPINFVEPQTDHDASDDIGEKVLGEQPGKKYRDDAASDINNFRTEILLQRSDAVIAMFGEKYKQWNTAMDVSAALTMNKPVIIIRPESLIHPLKELSNKANVTLETVEQALDVLGYVFE